MYKQKIHNIMYSKFFLFIYIVVCVILFIWLETKASNDDSVEKSSWGDVLKTLLSSLFAGFFIAALISAILYPIFAGVFGIDF